MIELKNTELHRDIGVKGFLRLALVVMVSGWPLKSLQGVIPKGTR